MAVKTAGNEDVSIEVAIEDLFLGFLGSFLGSFLGDLLGYFLSGLLGYFLSRLLDGFLGRDFLFRHGPIRSNWDRDTILPL